jgi:hypothetical protein
MQEAKTDKAKIIAAIKIPRDMHASCGLSAPHSCMKAALVTIGTSWEMSKDELEEWTEEMAKRVRTLCMHVRAILAKGKSTGKLPEWFERHWEGQGFLEEKAPVQEPRKKQTAAKFIATKQEERSFVYGFCDEMNLAWRVPSSTPNAKPDYAFEMLARSAKDTEECTARWSDGCEWKCPEWTCGDQREHEKAGGGKGHGARYNKNEVFAAKRVDGTIVRVVWKKNSRDWFICILEGKVQKWQQGLTKFNSASDAGEFATGLAKDYLTGNLDHAGLRKRKYTNVKEEKGAGESKRRAPPKALRKKKEEDEDEDEDEEDAEHDGDDEDELEDEEEGSEEEGSHGGGPSEWGKAPIVAPNTAKKTTKKKPAAAPKEAQTPAGQRRPKAAAQKNPAKRAASESRAGSAAGKKPCASVKAVAYAESDDSGPPAMTMHDLAITMLDLPETPTETEG